MLSTPVFWLGEFHGLYSPWGRKESDMTEQLSLHIWGLGDGDYFAYPTKRSLGKYTMLWHLI